MKKYLRYPHRKNELLQAWDAADEYLVQEFKKIYAFSQMPMRVLIINDRFGYLTGEIQSFIQRNSSSLTSKVELTVYSDSYVSHQAIKSNTLTKDYLLIYDLKLLSGIYDYVILRFPKILSFLEDIFQHLTHHCHDKTMLLCGSMIKHLSPGVFHLIEHYIGSPVVSLAQKKARVISSEFQKQKTIDLTFPEKSQRSYWPFELWHHSHVFSRENLDIGTRFFLENLPTIPEKQVTVLDLGCGNGIVGLSYFKNNPQANIIFTDDSWMAQESARLNFALHFQEQNAQFLWVNSYELGEANSVDYVLCNPPFHQDFTIGDFIARQMFHDSFLVLKNGGELFVIGNTHLKYDLILKKLFHQVRIINQNKKFIIWSVTKKSTSL